MFAGQGLAVVNGGQFNVHTQCFGTLSQQRRVRHRYQRPGLSPAGDLQQQIRANAGRFTWGDEQGRRSGGVIHCGGP